MSQNETEYAAAVAEFLRKKAITRCPKVCMAPTRGSPTEADRAALRNYHEAREAARIEKLRSHQQMLAS